VVASHRGVAQFPHPNPNVSKLSLPCVLGGCRKPGPRQLQVWQTATLQVLTHFPAAGFPCTTSQRQGHRQHLHLEISASLQNEVWIHNAVGRPTAAQTRQPPGVSELEHSGHACVISTFGQRAVGCMRYRHRTLPQSRCPHPVRTAPPGAGTRHRPPPAHAAYGRAVLVPLILGINPIRHPQGSAAAGATQ